MARSLEGGGGGGGELGEPAASAAGTGGAGALAVSTAASPTPPAAEAAPEAASAPLLLPSHLPFQLPPTHRRQLPRSSGCRDHGNRGRAERSRFANLRAHANQVRRAGPKRPRGNRRRHLRDHPGREGKQQHRHQGWEDLSDGLIGGIAVHRRDPVVRDRLEYAQHEVNQHQADAGTDRKRNVPFKIRRSPPAPTEAKEDVARRHHDNRFELRDHVVKRDDDVGGKHDAGSQNRRDGPAWLRQEACR